MATREWAPDAGNLIWLNFDPQSGREQAGRRPALVLSPESYNRKSGLAIACPITSRLKGYPFEVPRPPDSSIKGAVLVDNLKSLDWRARKAERSGRVPPAILSEVLDRLAPLLGF